MEKYRVWFDQINQDYFDVEANSEASACKKARALWKRDNSHPESSDIEVLVPSPQPRFCTECGQNIPPHNH